MYKQQ